MAEKRKIYGFGFDPQESQHHFLVIIPRNSDGKVIIYERFKWQEDREIQTIDYSSDRPKVELPKYKWKLIEDALKDEFNSRLKKKNFLLGNGKQGKFLSIGFWEKKWCFLHGRLKIATRR